KCGAALVLPLGQNAGTLLLGGEIAWSPAGAITPATLHSDWSGGSTTAIDTLTAGGTTGARVLLRGSGPAWWAKPWPRELCPDAQWQAGFTGGNVAPGAGGSAFQWQLWHAASLAGLPYGTAFTTAAGSNLGDAGTVMLVDCGSPLATFLDPLATVPVAQPTT